MQGQTLKNGFRHMMQDKQAFIQAIKDGTLNYYSACHENIRTEVNRVHVEVSAVGPGCMGITHASGAPVTAAECYTGINADGTTAYLLLTK